MLRGPLISQVTKSKVRSMIQKVMSFLVVCFFSQREHLQRGREEKSQSGSNRSHFQMSESWLELEIGPLENKFLGQEKASLRISWEREGPPL